MLKACLSCEINRGNTGKVFEKPGEMRFLLKLKGIAYF